MKKQKIRFAIFMLLLAVTACDNADYSKSDSFRQRCLFKCSRKQNIGDYDIQQNDYSARKELHSPAGHILLVLMLRST